MRQGDALTKSGEQAPTLTSDALQLPGSVLGRGELLEINSPEAARAHPPRPAFTTITSDVNGNGSTAYNGR